jgi:hypothetical protein
VVEKCCVVVMAGRVPVMEEEGSIAESSRPEQSFGIELVAMSNSLVQEGEGEKIAPHRGRHYLKKANEFAAVKAGMQEIVLAWAQQASPMSFLLCWSLHNN